MNAFEYPIPLIGLCAWSGTGKTTLMRGVVPLLKAEGIRVGVVKHAHHDFDIDQPGKDSYEIRKSGAEQILVASRTRMALIREVDQGEEPRLEETLRCIDHRQLDLVLVEGFKHESFPKIELYRTDLAKPRLYRRDSSVLAVASDQPLDDLPLNVVALDLNDHLAIARFVQHYAFGPSPEQHHVRCHQNSGELR